MVFLEPCLVGRGSYAGRGLLARNSSWEEDVDERGYLLVERWVASQTVALNDKPKAGEGLSQVRGGGGKSLGELLGGVKWPLIKVLDIGGQAVEEGGEVPPIPCHVHAGQVGEDGRLCRECGKLEAYHYPPSLGLVKEEGQMWCRLGLKEEAGEEEVERALEEWGQGDAMYGLCRAWAVCEGEGWTIRPGIVHAPAPWPTLEMQLPQDDYAMLAYGLGRRLSPAQASDARNASMLKGIAGGIPAFLAQAIDWHACRRPDFAAAYRRPRRLLEEGSWGSRSQTFFDEFYGESLALHPGASYSVPPGDLRPRVALVWSGQGTLANKFPLDQKENSEFLLLGKAQKDNVTITAAQNHPLLIYWFFPLNL